MRNIFNKENILRKLFGIKGEEEQQDIRHRKTVYEINVNVMRRNREYQIFWTIFKMCIRYPIENFEHIALFLVDWKCSMYCLFSVVFLTLFKLRNYFKECIFSWAHQLQQSSVNNLYVLRIVRHVFVWHHL